MSQAQQQATDTLFIGNLDPRVTRRLVYELCCQACRLTMPHILRAEAPRACVLCES